MTKRPKIRLATGAGILLSLLGIYVGYASYLQIASTTPPVRVTEMSQMPRNLSCVDVEGQNFGPTLNGISVGKTHWIGVMLKFRAIGIWDKLRGNVSYDAPWAWEQACFDKGRIVALHIRRQEMPADSLPEWIDLYGSPDIVTWGATWGTRSVIWAEEGILVVFEFLAPGSVDIENTSAISLFLYPPIPAEHLDNSWLIDALPDSPPEQIASGESSKDDDSPPEAIFIEDPWGVTDSSKE